MPVVLVSYRTFYRMFFRKYVVAPTVWHIGKFLSFQTYWLTVEFLTHFSKTNLQVLRPNIVHELCIQRNIVSPLFISIIFIGRQSAFSLCVLLTHVKPQLNPIVTTGNHALVYPIIYEVFLFFSFHKIRELFQVNFARLVIKHLLSFFCICEFP